MLTAKEIATKYAGRILRCNASILDVNGNKLSHFDGKVIGYKDSTVSDPSYVCVEVMPPAVSAAKLDKFNVGYHYTADRNMNAWGKKLLPNQIVPPADSGMALEAPKKDIPEWPDKCRDCGHPAFIPSARIDCSNPQCRHKFKTHSAQDLFLPAEMRPPGWDKDPNRKRRAGVDKDDFVICDTCKKRAVDGHFNKKDKLGEFSAKCPDGHTWKSDLHIGDKIAAKSGALAYKGKNVFVPYRI